MEAARMLQKHTGKAEIEAPRFQLTICPSIWAPVELFEGRRCCRRCVCGDSRENSDAEHRHTQRRSHVMLKECICSSSASPCACIVFEVVEIQSRLTFPRRKSASVMEIHVSGRTSTACLRKEGLRCLHFMGPSKARRWRMGTDPQEADRWAAAHPISLH